MGQFGVDAALKEQGYEKIRTPTGGHQVGAGPTAARVFPLHLLSVCAPSVSAASLWRETGFVHINQVGRTVFLNAATQCLPVGQALVRIALFVFQGLFWGVTFSTLKACHTAL